MVYIPTQITTATSRSIFASFPTPSGELVNSDTANTIPSFFNAVRLLANYVAKTPRPVYYREDDGGRIKDTQHPTYWLLNHKANKYQTSYNFFHTLTNNMIWSGNGYAYIERNQNLDPIGLWLLDPRTTYVAWICSTNGVVEDMVYVTQTTDYRGTTTQPIVLPFDDVLHVKSVSLYSGVEGISLVDAMRDVLGLAKTVVKFGALYFRNNAHVNKILKIPGWLTTEQQEQLKNSMEEYTGTATLNAHKVLTLMGGSDLTSLPISAEDAQFLQSRAETLVDVANAVGVPISKLGGKGFSQYNAQRDNQLAFLSDYLDPIFCNVENELETKLIRPKQINNFVEFDRMSILRIDADNYEDRLTKRYEANLASWEETRRNLNLSTEREGTYINDTTPAQPQTPPATQPQEPQNEPMDCQDCGGKCGADGVCQDCGMKQGMMPTKGRDAQQNKFETLTLAVLDRLKRRMVKAVAANKYDLRADHQLAIEESGIACDALYSSIENLQEELNNVLPEQRNQVIENWNLENLVGDICK